ncbi:MAG: VanW family protein [bacterium]
MKLKFVPWFLLLVFLIVGALLYPKEHRIGSYLTSLEGRTPNQIHNLKLAAGAINGVIVKPGEIFSFNEVVGPWSRDKGYRKAPVSYTGLMVPAWGGGVCQVSSTLYNAVLLAGLEIVERGPHYWQANYIAPGRDAAVAYGQLDLKFRNNYPKPIRIRAEIKGKKLLVEILSRYQPEYEIEVITREKRIEAPRFVMEGEEGVYPPGRGGYEVEVYRVFLKGGEEIKRELISSDEYPPLPVVIKKR